MTSILPADLLPIHEEYGKSMQENLLERTSEINGYNYTVHKVPNKLGLYIWIHAVKLWHVTQGHVVLEALSYYSSDRDPLTCPYHLLNVPGPGAEHGVEIKWMI